MQMISVSAALSQTPVYTTRPWFTEFTDASNVTQCWRK